MFIYKKAASWVDAAGFPGGGVRGVVLVHTPASAAGAGALVSTFRAVESHILSGSAEPADIENHRQLNSPRGDEDQFRSRAVGGLVLIEDIPDIRID